MANYYKFLSLVVFTLLIIGCSKDDDLDGIQPIDVFYKDALISANPDMLSGTWSIFEVVYQNNRAEIPPNFQNCGRDFFQFFGNGLYKEYILIEDYECKKEILELNWELDRGVLTLTNSFGQTNEMVITKLTSEQLIFKIKLDVDEDGEPDVIDFIAKKYTPPNDPDIYSYTFHSKEIESSEDKIRLEWLPYAGFYPFQRYEIYRSKNSCSKMNAELIGTIENASTNFFIDNDPPARDELCYFIKIYNDKGLLSESELIYFHTENLIPAKMGFSEVAAFSESVELNWQPYQGNYFSHYKITVRNYEGGTGAGYYEETVTEISDPSTTQYTDLNPPYIKNPVYAIYAYDIFGNVSSNPYHEDNTWVLDWKRPEVLDFDTVQFAVIDPDDPEVYLFGKKSTGQEYDLIKYNWQLKEVISTNKVPNLYTSIPMQVFNTENGKELFYHQGSSLSVYDAANLDFKYNLALDQISGLSDFTYMGNNIWVFINRNTLFTYKRENGNLYLIDQTSHFSEHQSNYNYHVLKLKNSEVLIGHYNEAQSFLFSIDTNGFISEGSIVDIPLKSKNLKKTFFSPDLNYLINVEENKLYSADNFSPYYSFEKPYFPTAISREGNLILGSNNDPNDEAVHEKKVVFHDITAGLTNEYITIGYPHLLFQGANGEIISISSGFKRRNLDAYGSTADLFVEVINL